MTKTAKNKLKVEITKTDSGDYDFLAKGGELTDYLALLSGVFIQLCKDNQLPVVPLINANFYELADSISDSNDKLDEYLIAYDEESIQKIRDEKKQLVTAAEFVGLHQKKLAAERKNEALREHIINTERLLLEEIELKEEYLEKVVDRPSNEGARRRAFIEGIRTAVATLDDEADIFKLMKESSE
ncbi:hypothetical protein [Lactococcus lactis]|uniref:hypothetical protein n=1 Tax=Lactococcus lactis TaxID=1358 RepID=UPI001D197536|nr:hypothetical protein [Lactococcus lactis]MCC4121525.1 hypothetical protein [Lactococcus lactis]